MKTYLCIHYRAWLKAFTHFKITVILLLYMTLYKTIKLYCTIFLIFVQALCFETYFAVLWLYPFPSSWQGTRQQKWRSQTVCRFAPTWLQYSCPDLWNDLCCIERSSQLPTLHSHEECTISWDVHRPTCSNN